MRTGLRTRRNPLLAHFSGTEPEGFRLAAHGDRRAGPAAPRGMDFWSMQGLRPYGLCEPYPEVFGDQRSNGILTGTGLHECTVQAEEPMTVTGEVPLLSEAGGAALFFGPKVPQGSPAGTGDSVPEAPAGRIRGVSAGKVAPVDARSGFALQIYAKRGETPQTTTVRLRRTQVFFFWLFPDLPLAS